MADKKSKTEKIQVEHVKCVWGLMCNISSIDQERNNVSLFNVIEQINLPKDFFIQQKKEGKTLAANFPHEIVMLWRRTLDTAIFDNEITADFKIKTVDPTGKTLQEILSPLKFPKGLKRFRVRVNMPGLLASVPGDYVHQLEIKLPNQNDFKMVFEIPFEIKES